MKKTTLSMIFAVLASNAMFAAAHAEGPMDHHPAPKHVEIVKKPVHHVERHHPAPKHHAPKREVIVKHEPIRHN